MSVKEGDRFVDISTRKLWVCRWVFSDGLKAEMHCAETGETEDWMTQAVVHPFVVRLPATATAPYLIQVVPGDRLLNNNSKEVWKVERVGSNLLHILHTSPTKDTRISIPAFHGWVPRHLWTKVEAREESAFKLKPVQKPAGVTLPIAPETVAAQIGAEAARKVKERWDTEVKRQSEDAHPSTAKAYADMPCEQRLLRNLDPVDYASAGGALGTDQLSKAWDRVKTEHAAPAPADVQQMKDVAATWTREPLRYRAGSILRDMAWGGSRWRVVAFRTDGLVALKRLPDGLKRHVARHVIAPPAFEVETYDPTGAGVCEITVGDHFERTSYGALTGLSGVWEVTRRLDHAGGADIELRQGDFVITRDAADFPPNTTRFWAKVPAAAPKQETPKPLPLSKRVRPGDAVRWRLKGHNYIMITRAVTYPNGPVMVHLRDAFGYTRFITTDHFDQDFVLLVPEETGVCRTLP